MFSRIAVINRGEPAVGSAHAGHPAAGTPVSRSDVEPWNVGAISTAVPTAGAGAASRRAVRSTSPPWENATTST